MRVRDCWFLDVVSVLVLRIKHSEVIKNRLEGYHNYRVLVLARHCSGYNYLSDGNTTVSVLDKEKELFFATSKEGFLYQVISSRLTNSFPSCIK